MKKILLIILLFVSYSSCKNIHRNVWTKEYETDFAKGIDDTLKSYIKNESQRKEFVRYFISKAKATLPQGVESISSDSLHKLSKKWGNEYEESHNTENLDVTAPWSVGTEEAFRSSFLKKYSKIMDKKTGEKFCDCMIAELKKLDPDSLRTTIPDSTLTKITTDCKIQVEKSLTH